MASSPSSRWPKVKRLFDEALDLAPADVAALLARHDADPVLVAEVRSLLAWHDGAGTFLESPAVRVADLAADPLVGQSLGPWRVVGVVGQGGMGIVYRAERADDAFTRQAAIKVIVTCVGSAIPISPITQEMRASMTSAGAINANEAQ